MGVEMTWKKRTGIGLLALLLATALPGSAWAGSGTARILSVLLPGAGHLYAGESSKGLTLLSVYLGTASLAIGTGPWTWEDERSGDPYFSDLAEGTGTSTTTKVIFAASAAAAAGTWLYAVWDAPRALERYSLLPGWKDGGPRITVTRAF